MTDIERLLTEAFQKEGEKIEPDVHKARHEFLQRRRKRRIGFAFSGVALAGAAVAAAVFVASSVPSPVQDDEIDLASAVPKVVASAPVAGAPEAAAVVSDGVWIANAEPGRVVKIDPETNEVVASVPLETAGTPDEIVAVGSSLAVTTTDGFIHILDAGSGAASDYEIKQGTGPIAMDIDGPTAAARPSDTFRLDLDVSGDTVWVANENNGFIYGIFNAGTGGKDFTGEPVEDIAPNDIAVGDGRVFGLDSDRGQVAVFEITGEPGPPNLERVPGSFDVPSGDYLDMRYGFGKLWISNESGQVLAFDPESGEELSVTEVGGRYADLVIDGDSVWALPGGDESGGGLIAIDPETGSPRNDGISIDGNPVDVVSGLGSLWIVDKAGAAEGAAGSLLRVDPTGVGTPSPDEPEEGEGDEDPVSSAQPFFAYSASGDIYLEMTDGTTKRITGTADLELNPTFGFDTLIFEYYGHDNDEWGLIEHNLTTGEERLLGIEGTHPVMSAGGDLAWVNADGEIEIWAEFSRAKGQKGSRIEVSLPEGLSDPRSLIFSDDAKYLYYQAIGEGWVTVQVSMEGDGAPSSFVLNGINDQPAGATYIQPEDPNEEGVTVLEVCCREVEGDPYSQFSVSRIAFTEGAATHEFVTAPADLADADPGTLTMASLHGASLSSEGEWTLFDDPKGSWLVTDGESLWFLHTGGGGQLAPETLESGADLGGLSVNPTLEGY